jgi:hypothetical protein
VTDPSHRADGDTSREALRVQFAALRRLTPRRRLELMDDLTMLVRSLAREGLRRRHPEASEVELDAMFSELALGRDLAARVRERRRNRSASPTP